MSELTPAGTPVPMDLAMLLTGVRKRLTEDTIEDVVAATGITRNTLYSIRDERRVPSFDTFQRLVNFYGYQITVTTHRVPTYQGER